MMVFLGRLRWVLVSFAFLLGVAGSLTVAAADNAPNPIASKVQVEGATRGDADVIRSYFTGLDQAAINRGIDDLTATGMYTKVSAKAVGGMVVVSVVEGGLIINRVAFDGTNKLKGEQLAVEVHSKPHVAFDDATAKGDVDRIKDAYAKIGRNAVKVTYRLVNLPNGRVDLVFTVDEGDKTGIKSINFVGNNVMSNWRLHNLMQLTEMNLLSWFKTSDVYNPDTLASDEETIRKYYMKNGYADFRIVNSDVSYKPDQGGYVITITVDEGAQYHVSSVDMTSQLAKVSADSLKHDIMLRPGDVYNATAVDKSVEAVTRDLARQGYAFADVRPHGERDSAAHTVALAFTIDNAPKVYIERVDIVGNTRTRDYVIRREFDIGEGDPYNHTLIEAAERRVNNLGFFKSVHISTRPGSAADRVIVTVQVEDKPTGSISLSGGYSTTAGILAEVAFTETNFLGRGQYVKLSASVGQYSNGWQATFTEPYFLDQHLAAGVDVFHKANLVSPYTVYDTWTTGVNLRVGIPVTDELTLQPNYSFYETQISIPNSSTYPYNDCGAPNNGPSIGQPVGTTWYNVPGTGYLQATSGANCLTDGEASLAIKEQAAQGTVLTSLVGYSLIWDNVDNRKDPTSGVFATFHQDFAGLGGNSQFIRETLDGRYYYPVTDDLVAMFRLQGGQINGIGGQANNLPIIDNFNLGPTLVRGFAPGGIGPRDISDTANISTAALGGTTYFGGTAELQFPMFGLPKELGLKGALFVDAGTLYGFTGQTDFSNLVGYTYCPGAGTPNPITQPSCMLVDDENTIRTSVGFSLIWNSPIGPLRFDLAYPVIKGKYDQTQYFNFTGGTTF
jgi:outer membrane protein insertion porin family